MAIVSVDLVGSQRRGTYDEKGIREYDATWRVITDDPLDGPLTVTKAPGIPWRGTPYIGIGNDIDLAARARTAQATEDGDDGRLWIVRVTFSTDATQQDEPDNPLEKPADISWQFNSQTKVVERDASGSLIKNKAKRQFASPIEIDEVRPVLTISKNMPSFDPGMAYSYANKLNASTW